MKKILSLVLSILLVFTFVTVSASAANESVTVNMVSYNVAGLPNVGSWIGKNDVNVSENQKLIGKYLSSGFDIVAVQEDFSYHENLVSAMSGFNYQTHHTGSFLGGDGMNIFTKNMPVYNETRVSWNAKYGVIESGADELANKGILYTVIDIGEGIYVDFYNIHADAFDTAADKAAREDNFIQLADMINENYAKNNRPVIVTGDFNHYFHTSDVANSNMRKHFIQNCGLKDAWVELNNDGNYEDFSKWSDIYGDRYWGIWDSVEKFLYKDGGGVTLTPESFQYTWTMTDKNTDVSDHGAAECVMTFTKTDDFVENTEELKVNGPAKNTMITELMWFLTILAKVLGNLDQVFALL